MKIQTNIRSVINSIRDYQNKMSSKTKVFLERLAEVGIEGATVRFQSAIYDGVNDVKMDSTPEWVDDHTMRIVARGKAVTFIEFGAGVHFNAQVHPKASELGAIRGTYGHGNGMRDAWVYRGDPGTMGIVLKRDSLLGDKILTHGNPANRCLYDVGKDLRREAERIAKEVFAE